MISQLSSSVLGVLRLLTPHEVKRLSSGQGEIKKGGAIEQTTVQSVGIQTSTSTEVGADANGKARLMPLQEFDNEEEIDAYKSKNQPLENEEDEAESKPEHAQIKEIKKSKRNKNKINSNELEDVGIFSSEKMRELEEEKNEEEKRSAQSASVFLLSERAKFKKARTKLKNIDATKEYCEKQKKDSSASSDVSVSSTGILLDKKLA